MIERNESLRKIITDLNKDKYEENLINKTEKTIDDNLLKNKIINYFNEKFTQIFIEVRNYYNISFSDYSTILNKPNFFKNLYYPFKRKLFQI